METYDIHIPYIEIRDIETRKIEGIIEGAEIFFEYAYNGVGAFEIYCRSTPKTRSLLKKDRLVTLPNQAGETEDNVWIIDKIQKQNSETGGRFITATGTEAKSVINRRIVRYTTVLTGGKSLVTEIRDKLFNPNIISPIVENRRLNGFVFMPSNVATNILDMTQVTWNNLLDYTETLYLEYGCASKLRFNKTTKNFEYTIYQGVDRSNKVVFSQANENLLSSDYLEDYEQYKTSLIVGGEEIKDEDGNETGVRMVLEIPSTETGFARREVFIDAKDLQRKYEDENGETKEMSETDYRVALKQRGLEKKAEEHSASVVFNGEIDTTNRRYKFNRDYYLGDIVKIRDEDENQEIKVRVDKLIRVQNGEGYSEYFEYKEI